MELLKQTTPIRFAIALVLALHTLTGQARPMDGTGQCAGNGKLIMADQRYGARPAGLPLAPRLAAEINHIAAELPAWFASEDPASNTARLYQAPDSSVVVLTRCNPASCDTERAYIGFIARSGGWGASVYLNGHVLELGRPVLPGALQQTIPEDIVPAVVCAQNLDWGN